MFKKQNRKKIAGVQNFVGYNKEVVNIAEMTNGC